MNLKPWKPKQNWIDTFDSFDELQREMNQLFNYPLLKGYNPSPLYRKLSPAVDIYDAKDKIKVKADFPGLEKDQIEVTAEDGVLTIKGEKKDEKETKENNCVRSERYYGSFYRSFTLPTGVDTQKIDASFKNGVLEVTLPKKEEVQQKQIKIEVK